MNWGERHEEVPKVNFFKLVLRNFRRYSVYQDSRKKKVRMFGCGVFRLKCFLLH